MVARAVYDLSLKNLKMSLFVILPGHTVLPSLVTEIPNAWRVYAGTISK
jgi:hypothetical protein